MSPFQFALCDDVVLLAWLHTQHMGKEREPAYKAAGSVFHTMPL